MNIEIKSQTWLLNQVEKMSFAHDKSSYKYNPRFMVSNLAKEFIYSQYITWGKSIGLKTSFVC